MPALTLEQDGAVRLDCAALSVLGVLRAMAEALPGDRAGQRLHGIALLRDLLANDGALGTLTVPRLGSRSTPVRALLFDKTPGANWALGWHQDRTIVVRERIATADFGPWTIKRGMVHVEPPAALQADMLTMRIHLDDVPADNAPLLIAPGSHRLGRIPEDRISDLVALCGTVACLERDRT